MRYINFAQILILMRVDLCPALRCSALNFESPAAVCILVVCGSTGRGAEPPASPGEPLKRAAPSHRAVAEMGESD